MIKWHRMDPEVVPAPGPPDKPYRVTRYWEIRARQIGPTFEAFFRRYWQANLVSFLYHHLGGWSCNTWKRKDPGTEPASM